MRKASILGFAGAVAALLAPVSAGAAPAPSTYVVSGNVAGPTSTFTEVLAHASCGGTPLSGGGAREAQTTPTVTHNGIHLDGSFPSPDGAAQAGAGASSPTDWVAAGGSGGAVPPDAQTLAYAVCLAAGPTATTVVVASTPGPTQTFQMVRATATCPPGTQLLSGGARTTPGTIGSLKPNGSFPSDSSGKPVLGGSDPTSWTVEGLNGGGGNASNTTYAFAVCATAGPGVNVMVVHAEAPGPALASTPDQVTATCPASTALLGGGGFVSDAYGLPGSQGDHLTGSYPSDGAGTPVASGVAASWTAASHSGGVDSGSLTQTDAWALCASPAGAPAPRTGATVPVETKAPRISGRPLVGSSLVEEHGSWTGRPARYAYRWLRCRFSGATCAPIAGARGPTYKLTAADIGSRIRVQETATDAAGAGLPAVSVPTGAARARRVTDAEIRAMLARQIVLSGREALIASILQRGSTVVPFTALEGGRGSVAWYASGSGGPRVLAADGTEAFPGPRATTIEVRLTPAGNRILNAAQRLSLTAEGTFVATGKAPITVSRTIVLTRRAVLGRAFGGLPFGFASNLGQADARVRYLARVPGGALALTAGGGVLAVTPSGALSMQLAGARPDPRVAGERALSGTANYLIGPRADWRTGVRRFRRVLYRSVYPGVNLRYQGTGGQVEYSFVLAPRADPSRIAIELIGTRWVRVDRAGNLRLGLGDRTLLERRPVTYQLVGRVRRSVSGRFVLRGPRRVGFAIGAHDTSRLLVIDPSIVFSTLFAGSPPGEGEAIAVDRRGDTFVTGETSSADFPVRHALERQPRGVTENAFVAKLGPAGNLIYATYLGGSRYTDGRGIAVDRAGDAYITGATNSTDFPTTRSAYQRSYGGGPFDAFVAKLSATGTRLVYSTFLGDTHYDEGNAIAVDAHGQAVVTGKTASPNFPVVRPLSPHTTSGAFVTRLDATGHELLSSTVFGGQGPRNHADSGFGIALDPRGDTFVTGETNDPGFPVVAALQPQLAGAGNAFVIEINAASTRVIYSTYLGGSGEDIGRAIAADAAGDAYVTGQTTSANFPTAQPIQATAAGTRSGGASAFVTELRPAGTALAYSTYLGGSGGDDGAFGIAVDRAHDVYVAGQTHSTDFPLARPLQPALRGPADAFVTELAPGGSRVAFSTYYGGSGTDAALALALSPSGEIRITGDTDSANFPRRGSLGIPRRYPTPGSSVFVASLSPGGG